MKPHDFKKGMRVKYIPGIADGDPNHPDCELGAVSSTNDKNVFVKYNNAMCVMIRGDEPYTAQATDPNDLVIL